MELGQLEPAMTGSKRYVVYVGIPGHAQRARGLRGPSYELQPDGSVKYLGQTQSSWEVFAVAIANRSLFLRTFIVIPTMSGLSDDDDAEDEGVGDQNSRSPIAMGSSPDYPSDLLEQVLELLTVLMCIVQCPSRNRPTNWVREVVPSDCSLPET